jgi:urease accessory protein UreH
LLAVDWVTSGRQRGYINHRFDCIRRVETHENWDFEEYYSVNEIKIDERMVFKDRIRLTGTLTILLMRSSVTPVTLDEEDDPIHARMKGYHVYGLIILVGKRFDPIKELILHSSLRKNLTNESDLVPQGRFILDNSEEVVASVSQIEKNGVVVRFCAYSSHSALTYVRSILAPLDVILGFKPYSENR